MPIQVALTTFLVVVLGIVGHPRRTEVNCLRASRLLIQKGCLELLPLPRRLHDFH
jgi:hypothetical protein